MDDSGMMGNLALVAWFGNDGRLSTCGLIWERRET